MTKSSWKKKKSTRIRWLPFSREKDKVTIIDDDQSSYTYPISKSDLPMSSYSLKYPGGTETSTSIRDHRYDKKELLKAESQVQKYVRERVSKVRNDRSSKLTSSSGVLLFDGVDEDFPDDVSFQNAIAEEYKYKSKDITFVVAPKDYDPVASGFYKPKRREDRTYYDSDEEESMDVRQQPHVTTGIGYYFCGSGSTEGL
jgi:hypothetical protein